MWGINLVICALCICLIAWSYLDKEREIEIERKREELSKIKKTKEWNKLISQKTIEKIIDSRKQKNRLLKMSGLLKEVLALGLKSEAAAWVAVEAKVLSGLG